MNRIAAILLMGLYLLTSTGLTVNVHYCLGQIDSIQVFAPPPHCCCDDFPGMRGCCDDETFFFQLDEDQITSSTLPIPQWELAMVVEPLAQWEEQIETEERFPASLERPPPLRLSRRIQYHSLTLYG
ncbi:MAG: hypothetical protein AAF399_26135 [Bacteroidota bacterium]